MNTEDLSISIALVGSGGAGVMTAGSLLLEAVGKSGLYCLMSRSSGPQIRGGEAAALLRISNRPVACHADRFDVLLAIDWHNADRFSGEIPLDKNSLVIGEQDGELPDSFARTGAVFHPVPFKNTARGMAGGRPNMIALGIVAALMDLPDSGLHAVIKRLLASKGQAAIESSLSGVDRGRELAGNIGHAGFLGGFVSSAPEETGELWSISGNEATGLGAVRGGIRFVAAYPITPATEVLEWLAPSLERAGGVLVQAEDELASVNQIIGASFGGTPSLTATSGPGLALMTESIGLAVASETPIVVVDVMRGGPSTGIPTKSEQTDLNIALYGLHGDAPHLVLAPLSIDDCLFTTQWAVNLAESLQTAAIVLSDQSLGQARVVTGRPADISFVTGRKIQQTRTSTYQRYAVSEGPVTAMAIPGMVDCQYTADGLEHGVSGVPSSRAEDHLQQLNKRRDKLDQHDYGDHWALLDGEGETAVITWGSSLAPVREALVRYRQQVGNVRLIAPRLLLPVQPKKMQAALEGVNKLLVIEQSHGAQFLHYLHAYYRLSMEVHSLAIPGPLPIRPGDVYDQIKRIGEI